MTYFNYLITAGKTRESKYLTRLLGVVLYCRKDEEAWGCDNKGLEMDGDDTKQTSL